MEVDLTDEQFDDCFNFGYNECRSIVIDDIKKILEMKSGQRAALKALLNELEEAEEANFWFFIQKDFPGMTREEYDAEMEKGSQMIRETFFSKEGYLKPWLVRRSILPHQG
jgi:hypothetical protein